MERKRKHTKASNEARGELEDGSPEPKRQRTKASSDSGGLAALSTKELKEDVGKWDAFLQVFTEKLGEGKLPDGTYLNDVLGVRGIAGAVAGTAGV